MKKAPVAPKLNARNRAMFAQETFSNAQETLLPFGKGEHKFIVSRGQFALIDVCLVLLDQIGPANVSLWTWSIADYEIKMVERLILDGRILSAELYCDYGSVTKHHATVQAWTERFGHGSVKFVINHAKMVRIWNADWKLLVRGSCNLNYNPRFEQMDIDDHSPAFDLIEQIEAQTPRCDGTSGRDCYAASKLGRAYEGENKGKLFGKLRLWDMGIEHKQLKTWKP